MERSGKPQQKRQDNNQDVMQYVRKVKENGNDAESFQKIVSALHSYLQHLSLRKFFFVPGQSSDDIYQEGLYALSTKAIPDYDADKGQFICFAKLCIRRHIITVLKSANNNKNKALNKSVSLDATVPNEEEDGLVSMGMFLANGSEDTVETLARDESHKRLKMLLVNKLTPLETKVLDLYLRNMSYTDIVIKLNKNRRGKNRLKPKVIDNALCRIKKKAMELEDQILKKQPLQLPMFFGEEEEVV